MIALTGLLRTLPSDTFWGRFQPSIDLGPHQAILFLRENDFALHRIELAGAEEKTVLAEPSCHGLILTRDFGVRLSAPCRFADGWAGELEAEVRLRWLDQASEWPRWIAGGRTETELGADAAPEQHLARLVAGLFEAELIRFFSDQAYREVAHRLNDPALIAQVETRVRHALSRWSEEGVVGLIAVHLGRLDSPAAERQRQSESETAQEQARLEREHRLRVLQAQQAAELAALRPAPVPAAVPAPSESRPAASTRISSLPEKQELLQRVLGGLASAQAEAVRVRLYSWGGERAGGMTDLMAAHPGGHSTLRIGEEIHVVVDSPLGGYLQLFNLGSSGEVSRLIPDGAQSAAWVEAGKTYLVSTGAGIAPVSPERPPLSPWFEQGPLNGFPERILAVVTVDNRALAPGDLHPAWSGPTAAGAGIATGFGAPRVEAVLSARPVGSWVWGVAEAAVAP